MDFEASLHIGASAIIIIFFLNFNNVAYVLGKIRGKVIFVKQIEKNLENAIQNCSSVFKNIFINLSKAAT